MNFINRILFTISVAACACLVQAQTVIVKNSLTPIEASSVMASYSNLFGYLNNPELDNPFPYAVIRIDLVGDVREAKMRLGLYLGTMLTVEAVNKDIENTILFVVPKSAKNIYLTCGDGCEKQTLYQGSLRSNKIYTCRVEYQKRQENTMSDASMQVLQEIQSLKEQLAQIQGQTPIQSQSSQIQRKQTIQSQSTSHADFTEDAWGINMKMIWVEGGDFLMGCTSEQGGDCNDDEKNVRRITLDGYWIGMCEVTQSQWEKVVGTSVYQQKNKANFSYTYGVGADYPMYYVSWDEAMKFCRLLSNKTGKTYTLPTEAQWEYAARGGNKADGTKYAGSNMVDAVAWYTDNNSGSTHPVGTKRGNSLGIYDMSGNVYEWCKDWYSSSYTSYDTNNPTGPSSGSYRVFRGGSWNTRYCRVSRRSGDAPSDRYNNLGFRVVCLP